MDAASSANADMLRVRIRPELRRRLESLYAQNGLTLTDAVDLFFQQSLHAGGLPFQVTEDDMERRKAEALHRLMEELDAGLSDPVSYSEEEVYQMFGAKK